MDYNLTFAPPFALRKNKIQYLLGSNVIWFDQNP